MKLNKKTIIEYLVLALVLIIATVKYYNDNKPKGQLFESYVFIDELQVLHTSSKCSGIKPAGSAEFLPLNKVNTLFPLKICSRCVTEEQLDVLDKVAEKVNFKGE